MNHGSAPRTLARSTCNVKPGGGAGRAKNYEVEGGPQPQPLAPGACGLPASPLPPESPLLTMCPVRGAGPRHEVKPRGTLRGHEEQQGSRQAAGPWTRCQQRTPAPHHVLKRHAAQVGRVGPVGEDIRGSVWVGVLQKRWPCDQDVAGQRVRSLGWFIRH